MLNSAQDPGPSVRWYYLTPSALLAIPSGVSPENRVAWARDRGALVVRRGNEIIWRRAQDPQSRPATPRKRGHLAVIK